jgi:hypothetical protein
MPGHWRYEKITICKLSESLNLSFESNQTFFAFTGKPQPRVLWFRNGKVFPATTWTKRDFENGKTLIYSNISVDSLSR